MTRQNVVPNRVRRRAFSPFATAVLSTAFSINTTPSGEQRSCLAAAIGTTERRVQVWFQNRRQRTGTTMPAASRAGVDAEAPSTPVPGDDASGDESDSEPIPQSDETASATTATRDDVAAASLGLGVALEASSSPALPACTASAAAMMAAVSPQLAAAAAAAALAFLPPAPMTEALVAEGRLAPTSMEVYTNAHAPFEILWATAEWLAFCGYPDREVRGKGLTLKCLQGPATDEDTLLALMDAVARKDQICVSLVNYTRHGLPFRHTLDLQPLVNSFGEAVLYRVASSDILPLMAQQGCSVLASMESVATAAAARLDDEEEVEEEEEEDDDDEPSSTSHEEQMATDDDENDDAAEEEGSAPVSDEEEAVTRPPPSLTIVEPCS